MLSAMARELVSRNGIGESADAVWKALNTEHQNLFETRRSKVHGPRSEWPGVLTNGELDPVSLVEAALETAPIVAFGQRREALSGKRRGTKPVVPEQASLFNF